MNTLYYQRPFNCACFLYNSDAAGNIGGGNLIRKIANRLLTSIRNITKGRHGMLEESIEQKETKTSSICDANVNQKEENGTYF